MGLGFPLKTASLVRGNLEMLGADPGGSSGSRPVSEQKDLEVLHFRVKDKSYHLTRQGLYQLFSHTALNNVEQSFDPLYQTKLTSQELSAKLDEHSQ